MGFPCCGKSVRVDQVGLTFIFWVPPPGLQIVVQRDENSVQNALLGSQERKIGCEFRKFPQQIASPIVR